MELYHLKQLQSLPLDIKVMKTEQRIIEWYNHWHGNVYVSFSGGKDSTVLLDIARRLYKSIPAVFVDTGLEYPEIREFVKSFDNITWLKPAMNFRDVVQKYGYPVVSKEQAQFIREVRNSTTMSGKLYDTRLNGNKWGQGKISQKWRILIEAPFKVSEKCCDIMKKKPFHIYGKETGRKPIIGTMAAESRLRYNQFLRHGCNAFDMKRPTSNPMSFWHEQDVLQYIKQHGIKHSAIYGELKTLQPEARLFSEGEAEKLQFTGEQRTGCMFCMFGVHMEDNPNRFQRMKVTHPAQYKYCMENMGIAEVLSFIGVEY